MTSTEADNKPEHGETAIPGFGKLNEAKASRRLSHVLFRVLELIDCYDLRLPMAVSLKFRAVLRLGNPLVASRADPRTDDPIWMPMALQQRLSGWERVHQRLLLNEAVGRGSALFTLIDRPIHSTS